MAGQPSAAQPSVGVGWAHGLAEVQMEGLALLLVCGNSLAKASQMWEMKSDPGNQRASACVRRCCSVHRGRRPVLSLRNRFWRYLSQDSGEKGGEERLRSQTTLHSLSCGRRWTNQLSAANQAPPPQEAGTSLVPVCGYTCRVLTCSHGPTSEPRQREASGGRQRCPPAAAAPLEAAACHT